MKNHKILIIVALLVIITILIAILSSKTERETRKKIVVEKKIDIPKITIDKNNTELVKVVSALKSIIEEDESSQHDTPTEDEIQNVLSNLKALKPVELEKEPSIKKELPVKKKKVIKKERLVKKKTPIKKKKVVKKVKSTPKPKKIIKFVEKSIPKAKPIIMADEYRKKLLQEEEPDIELMSLPMVQTVDMNIEKKIEKGEIKELTTPKPLVEEKTIYIPSNEKKIDEDIPWAKLHEVDERVDGVLIEENIN